MKIKGFTPVSDKLIKEFGLLTATVYGKIWRYCDAYGKCKASKKRLAEELGISERTIFNHLKPLEEHGYIRTIANEIGPSTIMTTGKLSYETTIEEKIDPMQELQTPYAGNADKDTLIDTLNKMKEDKDKNPYTVYEKNIGPLAPLLCEKIDAVVKEWENHRNRLKTREEGKDITGERAFLEAAKIAVSNKGRNIGYIEKVIKNWITHGYGWNPN